MPTRLASEGGRADVFREQYQMEEEEQLGRQQRERRDFLSCLGGAIACGAATVAASAVAPPALTAIAAAATGAGEPANPAIPDYDWTKHRWAFGVDATKCIGCLRCVEACKRENDVPADAHHFRTWVERYVYLEGEEEV